MGIFPQLGEILYAYDTASFDSKDKMFIVVACTQTEFATVYINTNINPNLFKTPEARAAHYQVKKVNNGFLRYDSYIDCSDIKQRKVEEWRNNILAKPSIRFSQLNATDLIAIQKILRASTTIKPKLMIKYSLK